MEDSSCDIAYYNGGDENEQKSYKRGAFARLGIFPRYHPRGQVAIAKGEPICQNQTDKADQTSHEADTPTFEGEPCKNDQEY